MADRNLAKWQIASLAIIILIIPLIIVFQLTKADIVINFNDDDPFFNKCFLGQSECVYQIPIGIAFDDQPVGMEFIEFREDKTYWWILGEDVWCIKTERTVAEPVSDPVGVITEETEIECNDLAMFDKGDWDLTIDFLVPNEEGGLIKFSSVAPPPKGSVNQFTFTMKGT